MSCWLAFRGAAQPRLGEGTLIQEEGGGGGVHSCHRCLGKWERRAAWGVA